MVQANGGVGINGAPKTNAIELSIYQNVNGSAYPNIFLGNTNRAGGIVVSAGDTSSSTSNDAGFYIDEFDGTNQTRRFSVTSKQAAIGDASTIPSTFDTLNVGPSSAGATSGIALAPYAKGTCIPFCSAYVDITNSGQDLVISAIYPNVPSRNATMAEFDSGSGAIEFESYDVTVSKNLTVNGSAFKPGGGTWTATSDRRIKQDVAPVSDAVDTLLKLRPVSFRYTAGYRAMEGGIEDKRYMGFVAQEYADVFPEAVVSTGKSVPGSPSTDSPILALDPNPALITTVAAVQQLAVENASLRESLAAQSRRIDELATTVAALKAREK